MPPKSITAKEIHATVKTHPKDRYVVREVNGDSGQHWAVSNTRTWATLSLSYTRAEAVAIAEIAETQQQTYYTKAGTLRVMPLGLREEFK